MLAQIHGQAQLGAHAVGAGDQHRFAVTGGQFAQGAEAAQPGHDFRAAGAFGDMLDAVHQGVAGVDIDAGVFIAQ